MLRVRPSLWTFDTSEGGGAAASSGTAGFGPAVTGGGGSIYLVPPAGGSTKLDYFIYGGGIGAGVQGGTLAVTGSASTKDTYSRGQVYMLESFKGSELKVQDFVGPCMVVELSGSLAVVGGAITGMLVGMDPRSLNDDLASFLVWAAGAQAGGQMGADALTDVLHLQYSAKALLDLKSLSASVGLGASLTGSVGYLWIAGMKPPEFPMPTPSPGPEPIVLPYRITKNVTVFELAGDVLFCFDKSDIRREATPVLTKVGTTVKAHPGSYVFINGYTDSVGTDAYNIGLSMRRAETVANWLVSHGFVKPANVKWFGLGKTQPKASNSTAAGRQQNRRVEIRIFR